MITEYSSRLHFRGIIILLMLLPFFNTGCSTNNQQKKVMSLHLVATADVNPDINGRASPIAITIYQLVNSSSFKKSDYMSLAENANSVLGKDLLTIDTVIVQPGQSLTLEYAIANSETAFGLVANYRIIDNSGWQLIYEYPRESSAFWMIFGGKKVSAHDVLIAKNRAQFKTTSQEH